jgi:predicted MFS family arabinose efflux permease
MAATDSMAIWFALRFLTGVASAGVLVFSTALVLATLRARGRAGLAGVHFGGVGLGIALSGALLSLLGPAVDWRGGWIAVALLSLALLAVCRDLPHAAPPPAASSAGAGARADRAHRWATAVLIVAYFLEGVGYIVTGTFLVAIARGEAVLAPYAGWFWVVVGVAGTPSALLWTMAGRPLGPWLALMLAFGAQAVGIVLPVLAPDLLPAPVAFAVSALLFGGTFMGITALTLPLGAAIAPMRPDRIMALLTASFGLGQILGPIAAGQLSAGGRGFAPALIAAASVVALGCALLAFGRRAMTGVR